MNIHIATNRNRFQTHIEFFFLLQQLLFAFRELGIALQPRLCPFDPNGEGKGEVSIRGQMVLATTTELFPAFHLAGRERRSEERERERGRERRDGERERERDFMHTCFGYI